MNDTKASGHRASIAARRVRKGPYSPHEQAAPRFPAAFLPVCVCVCVFVYARACVMANHQHLQDVYACAYMHVHICMCIYALKYVMQCAHVYASRETLQCHRRHTCTHAKTETRQTDGCADVYGRLHKYVTC